MHFFEVLGSRVLKSRDLKKVVGNPLDATSRDGAY